MSPRILVDVDGVLRDLIGGSCRYLNAKNGTKLTPESFTSYELHRTLSDEELADWKVWAYGGGYLSLKWYRGAKEFLFWLRGHADVEALTAAVEDRDATKDFLQGFVDGVTFALPQHKRFHSASALIEDRLATLLEWVDENPRSLGVLIDRPWNREPFDHERIVRVDGFAHARHVLQSRIFLKESA